MCARGLDTPEAARAVCGGGDALSDPMLLSGMEAAVARIHRAIDDGERIAVFGDYDVDGVTATALLYTYLDSAGADVYYKLPSRDDDGYGLSETAVDLMAAKGVSLIVTVDNGVSANAAIAHAKEQGVDVVVTDHHLPPQTLPEAAAIVNPQLPGDESPCKTLSGAGVAFKLAAALDGCTPDEMLPFYGDLAAIGTIADIMLLEGENRRIVKAGLALLQQTERPGIAALIEACGLGGKELTAENVSFGLAPRLNAAGRMDSAAAALELLLCEDPEEAEAIVAGLEAQNAARQKAEQDILQGVLDSVAADETYGADRILVVWGRGYHQGVIGIVASRVVERFGKPAIIVSVDENGEGKGSGRSIAGVSLYNAIAACGAASMLVFQTSLRPAHPVRRTRAGRRAVCAGGKPARVPQGGQRVGRAGAPGAQAPGAAAGRAAGAVRPERRGRGRAVGARAVWPRQPHAGIFCGKRCDRRSISPQRGQAHAPAPEAGRRSAVCGGVRPGAGRAGLQCG